MNVSMSQMSLQRKPSSRGASSGLIDSGRSTNYSSVVVPQVRETAFLAMGTRFFCAPKFDLIDTMKKLFACLAVTSAFLSMPSAFAANEPSKTESVALNAVRKPATRYEGTLSNKRILMVLSQEGTTVDGAYAYMKQGAHDAPRWIDLSDTANAAGGVTLVEKFKDKVTGQFDGKIAGNAFSGTWRSPDGKSLQFTATAVGTLDNLRIVARVASTDGDTKLRALDIYRDQKLPQSLPADANIFTSLSNLHYDNRDLNFDGYPDLAVPVENGEQLYWLYDPAQHRYMDAPASLRDINVTHTRYSTDEIYEEYSGGSKYKGMNVYKYADGKYCLIEENVVSGDPEKAKISKKKYPVSQCKTKED